MGKIFGISDLPVSTIMTPFEPIYKPIIQNTKVKTMQGFVPKDKAEVAAKVRKSITNLIKNKKRGMYLIG